MSLSEDRNAQLIRENRRLLRAMREREMLLLDVLGRLSKIKGGAGTSALHDDLRKRLVEYGLIGK